MQTRVRNILLFGVLGLSMVATATGQNRRHATPLKTNVDPAQLATRLQTLLPDLMQKAHIPGLQIALVRDAKIAWTGSFGVRSLDKKEPVDDNTVFQAASLSKPVFAYAVLQLVEEGVLDLDAPISSYLPGYIDDPRIDLITPRIVLSHTTGFPNWRPRGGKLEILFPPGDRFSYSGEGYVYLQKAVEKVTGQSLNALMKTRVFEPLQMTRSNYVWVDGYESDYAVGHSEFDVPIRRDNMTTENAAASLYTTASDYAKFLVAVLQRTGLKESTFTEMLTPQVYLDDRCLNCTQTPPANLSKVNGWGLGWGLQKTPDGLAFWHWGDQGIFRCYTVSFDAQKLALIYFTNSENGLSIRDELVRTAIGGEHPAFGWLHYEQYDSPVKEFSRLLVHDGLDSAMTFYGELKRKTQTTSPVFAENAINSLGYQLIYMKRLDDAIAVFKLNVAAYPDSWNVYDSLGEAYMNAGQTELAILNYKRSIEINPDNRNGIEMLEKLTGN